jgi:short subunit dehydrogenase-like uncharacterized protein
MTTKAGSSATSMRRTASIPSSAMSSVSTERMWSRAIAAAAQVKPVREFLKKRVPQGQGPDERRREKSWFTVDLIGESNDREVHVRVSGGDPGYTETAKMLAEAAMCVALDENPPSAGQVTTAQAMGDSLLARLQTAGIEFTVL